MRSLRSLGCDSDDAPAATGAAGWSALAGSPPAVDSAACPGRAPVPEVALAARSALVAIGPAAIPGLVRELVTGSDPTREHCSVALVALGEPALPPLVVALDAQAPQARKAALSAIASILERSVAAPDALAPALDKLAADDDPAIALAARRLQARGG